jgi:hypothetical protein
VLQPTSRAGRRLDSSKSNTEPLLLQPGGLEGRIAAGEVLHPYHQATPHGEERKERFIDRYPAARATPSLATSDEQAVAKVDDLLGFEPVVIRHLESHLPDADVRLVAVMDPDQIGWEHAADGTFVELELELLINAEKENLEVPSIRGFVCPAKVVRGQRAAQPRAWRQSRPSQRQHPEKNRHPDQDPFIQGPPTGLARNSERRSHATRDLDVLVRNARSPRWLGHGFQRDALSQALELAH